MHLIDKLEYWVYLVFELIIEVLSLITIDGSH